jgi:2-amino-4-hydroxy-6-hydroxymethyldihydropteridine diphosphokinase
MATTSYAIALGSNRSHGRLGRPEQVVRAAIEALGAFGAVERVSRVMDYPALGPGGRDYANAAAVCSTEFTPSALMAALKQTERDFGRRPGRRWGPRVLDLDIILWSGGVSRQPGPSIPHPEFRNRLFVLQPLAEIAPDWRDPVTGLSVRHLLARLTAPRPARR